MGDIIDIVVWNDVVWRDIAKEGDEEDVEDDDSVLDAASTDVVAVEVDSVFKFLSYWGIDVDSAKMFVSTYEDT